MMTKPCRKQYMKDYYEANKDKTLAANKLRYQEKSTELCEQNKAYREANKDKVAAKNAAWDKANRSARNAIAAAYRASKLNATPDWLTGTHKAHIKRTYALATMMTEATGVPYHVDHIVPLQGKFICGLHVPWNLQALRADLNMSKSNKHEDDSSYPQVTTTG